MNEIRFRIDAERMTFDDFIAMVEGTMSEKRNVMAFCGGWRGRLPARG